jgi:hypothetical protein
VIRIAYALVLSIVAACAASPDPADADAETAAPALDGGKADATSFTGLYHISSSTWHANDITDLELRDTGNYVRARCYHASCAEQLAETDTYDVITSHGKKYVRFNSVELDSQLTATPVITDVYEIRTISRGIQLRKTYTSRWFSLFTATVSSQCAASGGTLSGSDCTCPNATYSDSGYEAFVAGAGGCIWAPSGSEQACDDSGGSYTDDDATAISTYCVCGIGRTVATDGSCAAI